MIRTNLIKRRFLPGLLLLLLGSFNLFSQTQIDSAKYITVNQDVITVYLNEPVTLTTAAGWSVNVGGTVHTYNSNTLIRPNIQYLSGSGTNTINFRLLFVFPKTNIEPPDVAAGVTVSYNGSGNTKNLLSVSMGADGPVTAVNDRIITCDMLTSVQSIGVENSTGPCQPVSVQMKISWNWSMVARNSTHFNTNGIQARTSWNDLANTKNNYNMTEDPINSGKYVVVTPLFSYSIENTCTFNLAVYPIHLHKPSDLQQANLYVLWGTTQARLYLPAYRLDNQQLGGNFQITPATGSNPTLICRGSDIDGFIFHDATEFNCNSGVEPDRPNEGTRWTQFVYGTHSGAGIPNVYIDVHGTMVQITDNDGNFIPGPFTVDPNTGATVAPYDTASGFYEGPVEEIPEPATGPTAQTFPIYHTGNYYNDQVNDVFEVTLRNWGPCNKYIDFEAPIETTSELRLIEAPPPPNPGTHDHCFGSVPGTISVTGTGGDIDWYSDSTLITLIKNNSSSYTHGETAVGSYYYWVNETGGNGCVGPDTMVTLTINPLPLNNQPVSDPVICAGETATITIGTRSRAYPTSCVTTPTIIPWAQHRRAPAGH